MHMLKNINKATLFVVHVDNKRKLLFIDHLNILNVRLSRRPKYLDCQFKAMLNKHESLHKKRLALTKALHAHVYANRDKPGPIGLWVVFKNIQ